MRFAATPGWDPPAVVVCGFLPLLAAGPCCGSLPLLVGVCRLRWGVSLVGVSRVVCVCGLCGCAWWPCCGVFCVFVVSVLLVVWCSGVALVCLPRALLCVVACACCAGGLWLVFPPSFGSGLRQVIVWVWLACAVGPPPLLAEGPGCSAPPLLAWVCRCAVVVGPLPLLAEGFGCGAPPLLGWVHRLVWRVVPRHSWPRAAPLPAIPGWGPPVVVVRACPPLWAPGCPSPWPWYVCVCVCAVWRASCWFGWCAGVLRGVVAVCECVCACGVWFVGCVIPWSVRVVGRHGQGQKAEKEVL